MAVNFYLDKRSDKKGDNPIIVSIIIQRERFLTSTGHSINPDKWIKESQRVKQGSTNGKGITYNTINSRLSDIESFFAKIENNLQTSEAGQQVVDLKQLYAEKFRVNHRQKLKEKTIFNHIDEFITEAGRINDWTTATVEKFEALKIHLQKFNPALTYEHLNEKGLLFFVEHLKKTPLLAKKVGMRNSTIKKQLGFLKWFLRWATKKGYNTEQSFEKFNPKLKSAQKQIVFLEWTELLHLYSFDFTTATDSKGQPLTPGVMQTYDKVRDVFCFSALTGLRYSDVANLKRSNIIDDCIVITSIKDVDNLTIELNDRAKAILQKYEKISFPYDTALPIITNQRMNEYLKEIGKICKFDTPITEVYYKGNDRIEEVKPKYEHIGTHTARRTFISNALMKGIPTNVVMKWTGHSDYNAMKPYIAIADKAKASEMKKFND